MILAAATTFVVNAQLQKSLSDPYQSRYNSIPLIDLQGILANQFNKLYYQCQHGHNLVNYQCQHGHNLTNYHCQHRHNHVNYQCQHEHDLINYQCQHGLELIDYQCPHHISLWSTRTQSHQLVR